MSERFVIPASLDRERLDRALALVTERPRAAVAAAIAAGQVRVDGVVVRVRHHRIGTGEVVDAELEEAADRKPEANPAVGLSVLFEDEDVLVLDKPAGLVVHPGAGHVDDTLVSGLLAAYPELEAEDFADPRRPGVVHRLDKETSGVLVVARTEAARRALSAQLAARTMGRTYLALALGRVDAPAGVIDAQIGRSRRDPTRMAVRDEGRPARTAYRVLERFSLPAPLTLLELHLETGRTHQIRVHLQALNHPVAGDRRYGGGAGASLGLRRPFLHAARVTFDQPRTGERIEVAAELPAELAAVLAHCRGA